MAQRLLLSPPCTESQSLQPATHWLVLFRPARRGLLRDKAGPFQSLPFSSRPMHLPATPLARGDSTCSVPSLPTARLAAQVRNSASGRRPPSAPLPPHRYLKLVSRISSSNIHSLGSVSPQTCPLLSDPPSKVIERHRTYLITDHKSSLLKVHFPPNKLASARCSVVEWE